MIDTHTHLNDPRFDDDREAVRARARQAGVERVIHCGYSLESSRQALGMAQAWGDGAAVGVHPHDARSLREADLIELRHLAAREGVVAIGETGLDYHYDEPKPSVQQEALGLQVRLAAETGLPLVLHSREAHDDLTAALRQAPAPVSGVFHCFTGTREQAEEILDLGFYLGAAGVVTFPKSGDLREVFAWVPLDRVLLETDSPYMAPPPYRGKRCEPAYVARVLETLAEVRGLPAGEVEQATTENALRCFPRLRACG